MQHGNSNIIKRLRIHCKLPHASAGWGDRHSRPRLMHPLRCKPFRSGWQRRVVCRWSIIHIFGLAWQRGQNHDRIDVIMFVGFAQEQDQEGCRTKFLMEIWWKSDRYLWLTQKPLVRRVLEARSSAKGTALAPGTQVRSGQLGPLGGWYTTVLVYIICTQMINKVIHTYIYTCILSYCHTVILYIHPCMHAYMHACMHTYIHTYIHSYIPTYTHTQNTHHHVHCTHTYIFIHYIYKLHTLLIPIYIYISYNMKCMYVCNLM